ncbi:PPE domain-containing protein [Williamsia sterculiae]|uniref:PPE family protein n=1 Tax=Williamsia sterculiae TaxID=1344003 RepID=A0A1N7GSQ0_9NOCA|nr:PPE domain-containing protein [Williamsia sterculiae]SIS15592.1 PPE family protein [Williamsia sterculiae]
MTGFTGVAWDGRTTERLAHDLVHGAGPAPLAEAGLAWAQVAALLADAGVQYQRIVTELGRHWQSTGHDTVQQKLRSLSPWFEHMAGEAAQNAVRAEGQAAADTVARLTMPNVVEIEANKAIHENATRIGAALGAPINGVAARAENALHDQKVRAARVMQTYESATAPVAESWPAPMPPQVVSGKALAAEQAARRAADGPRAAGPPTGTQTSATRTPAGAGVGMIGMPMVPVMAPTPLTGPRAAATMLASGTTTVAEPRPAPIGEVRSPVAAPPTPIAAVNGLNGDRELPTRRAEISASGDDVTEATDGLVGTGDDAAVGERYRTERLDLFGTPAQASPAVIGAAEGGPS